MRTPSMNSVRLRFHLEELSRTTILVRSVFLAGGFCTILGIVGHVSHAVPMHLSAPFIILPLVIAFVLLGFRFPGVGRIALSGWLAGVVAVLIYDCTRWPFVIAGLMPDFIPRLGEWVFQEEGVHYSFGYFWRYAGNGGGMGMAFIVLLSFLQPTRNIVFLGVAYGLWIFSNLVGTLLFFPDAQTMLFPVTPLNFSVGLVGHIVYGLVLGVAAKRLVGVWCPKRTWKVVDPPGEEVAEDGWSDGLEVT